MIRSAEWITPAGGSDMKPCHFRAEKRIELAELPEFATLQIACDSYYYLEINGRKA